MAIAEWISVDETGSYGGNRGRVRIRLTNEESRNIKYVLCEWGGEVMSGSSAAQAEALASDPKMLSSEARAEAVAERRRLVNAAKHREDRWRVAWEDDAQTQYVNPSHSTSFHGWEMTPADRWCDDRSALGHRRRGNILRAWRALSALAQRACPDLVILNALFGDRPPGLPPRGIWTQGLWGAKGKELEKLDEEYRRVVRYVDGAGGTSAAFEAMVYVDERQRTGERPQERQARLVASRAERDGILRQFGAGCERLIAAATEAYRDAWQEAT